MLTSGMQEAQSGRIVMSDISPAAFRTVLKVTGAFSLHSPLYLSLSSLQHLYSGQSDINEENVIELLIISNIYSLSQLQEQCENYIESGIQLDNVTDLLRTYLFLEQQNASCSYSERGSLTSYRNGTPIPNTSLTEHCD